MLQAANLKAVDLSVMATLIEQSTSSNAKAIGEFAVTEIDHPEHGSLQFIDAALNKVLVYSSTPETLNAIN